MTLHYNWEFLTQAAGLTLGLHQGESITLLAGSLDVADDGTALIALVNAVDELDAHLGDVSAGASAAEDLLDLAVLDLLGGGNDLLSLLILLVGLGGRHVNQ
eukprot:458870_1